MNTGMLFRIFGESSYSKFRRLLIANSGLIYSHRDLKKIVIEALRKHPEYKNNIVVDDNSMHGLAEKVEYIERKRFKNIVFENVYEDIPSGYYPKRHCQKCTEAYFHTMLFDLPWITKCPVHNIKLINICANCKQPLSRITKILENSCDSCGCIGSLSRAIKKRAEDDYRIFEFSQPLEIVDREKYPHIEYKSKDGTIGNKFINKNSWIYPHIVYKDLKIDNKKMIKLGYFTLDSPVIKSEEFDLKLRWNREPNRMIEHHFIIECYIKITERVIKALNKHIKHKIGSCYDKKNCLYCDSFELWVRYMPVEVKQIFQYVSRRSFKYGAVEDMVAKTVFETYKTLSPIFTIGRWGYSTRKYLPVDLTFKLFKIQLWSVFLTLFYYRYLFQVKKSGIEKGYKKASRTAFNTSYHVLCPVYLQFLDNKLILQYPAYLDNTTLDLPTIKKAFNFAGIDLENILLGMKY